MSSALTTEQVKPTMLVSRSGLQLRTLDEVWRFAQCLAKSGLAPKGIESPEAITIAVQMGMEVGLPPMAAMQNIAVINGRPSIWGDAQLAVVRGTGELEIFEEWFEQSGKRIPRNPTEYKDDTTAVCRVKRAGYEPQESGYSVADAKRAGLWDKAGPWKQVPFRMLRMRARSFVLRDAFGDALRGLMTTEEAQDLPPKQVSGHVVEPFPLGNDSPSAGDLSREPANVAPEKVPAIAAASGAETTSAGTPLVPADAHAEDVGGGRVPPAPDSPKGATPARRTPKPAGPPLELSPEPETTYQRLTRKIAEAGLVHTKVETWLSKNDFPPLSMLSQADSEQVLELFGALQEDCRP